MDAYELPELYMPWPARASPDLDAAREHAREWASELGMFEPGGPAGWTVEHYDRCDFPLFVALVHADARGEPLNAMTCFYVWSFYFDDVFFRTFTPRADLAGSIVQLVNQHRASLGLAPLVGYGPLAAAAGWKARHMAAYGYMAHDDPAPPVAVDPRLLEILVCPVTKGKLTYDRAAGELVSRSAGLAYPIRDGIPVMLPEEARRLED